MERCLDPNRETNRLSLSDQQKAVYWVDMPRKIKKLKNRRSGRYHTIIAGSIGFRFREFGLQSLIM